MQAPSYNTSDIIVAASLVALDHVLVTIERLDKKCVMFCFAPSAQADAEAIASGEQTVVPYTFLEARRSLLRRADAVLGRRDGAVLIREMKRQQEVQRDRGSQ